MTSPSPATAYREHRPHPALAALVACYWTYRGRDAAPLVPRREAVVPDACMDLLFDRRDEGAALVGTMTRPLWVRRDRAIDLLGVRFRPGAARAFLDVPAAEVTDLAPDLRSVMGRPAEALRSAVLAAGSPARATSVLDAFLLGRLRGGGRRGADARVLAAAHLLDSANGAVRVDDLARQVGLGRRQLERAFLASVGIGPKATGRILRFQAALRRILGDPRRALSSIALATGYHDQAHLTREFRALSGESPGAYRSRRRAQGGDDAFVQDAAGRPA